MTAEHSQAVTHPLWCDRTRCTAPAEKPTEYDRAEVGEHRSALVEGVLGVTAYLVQAVTPWECSAFLRVESERETLGSYSFAVDVSSPLLLLMRQQAAEEQKRFPSLVPPLDAATS